MKAVILAGGRGTRLHPFTISFPKPLMPVGDLPILEILLRQLRLHDVTDVTLLTGHLGHLIEAYFGDGSSLGLALSYLREAAPLGTAGPLRQLVGRMDEPFLVMNGDLLTDVDFSGMAERHHTTGAGVTIGTFLRHERLELGVLRLDEDGNVLGYDEKPTLDFHISMGLYVMSPDVLGRIPASSFDMPQLIVDMVEDGGRVGTWIHDGMWLDIGRIEDYGRANELFASDRTAFLPISR